MRLNVYVHSVGDKEYLLRTATVRVIRDTVLEKTEQDIDILFHEDFTVTAWTSASGVFTQCYFYLPFLK